MKPTILVVDDKANMLALLSKVLGKTARVLTAKGVRAALAILEREPVSTVVCDLRMADGDGLEVLRSVRVRWPGVPFILMTAYASVPTAVQAMREGAYDYVTKPFDPDELRAITARALAKAAVMGSTGDDELDRFGPLFGRAPAMRAMYQMIDRVAPTDATVLLLGETGTGKGVLARHIHALSQRAARPFVTVNCAVIAPTLIESELFGHTRGAFTGADTARAGHIEAAGTGTLFLDEVGDLPREAQGKLLRLLEEQEYVRVGDVEPRRADARVIAATHRDLKTAAQFREDLYFRLNVVTLTLPPLRERREDITELAETMLPELAAQHRRRPVALSSAARAALVEYDWPGNLRELVNVLERCVILVQSDEITPDLLPEEVRAHAGLPVSPGDESLESAERRHIASILAKYPRLDTAARVLGIDPSTLFRKRTRYGLQ